MAEIALIAGLASAGASIFGGYSKMQEGKEAKNIAGVNAANLRMEGDAVERIARYNADVARKSGEFDAMQLERAAGEEQVAAQIAAREKRGDLARVVSSQRALAAAGGAGGVETAGVLDLIGDTTARGEYLADLETFGGETRARGRLNQAASARARAIAAAYGLELEGESAKKRAYSGAEVALMQGKAAKKAGKNAMWGSILEGAGKGMTAYKNFGR